MKRIFYFLGVLLVLASCTGNKESHVVVPVEEPQPVLLIQPYNDVTVQEAERLKAELERELPRLTGDDFVVKVLPVRQLSDSLKNDARTRFRADKILTWQTRNIAVGNAPTTLLGFTHSDISLPYKGRPTGACWDCRFEENARQSFPPIVSGMLNATYGKWLPMSLSMPGMPIPIARTPTRSASCRMQKASPTSVIRHPSATPAAPCSVENPNKYI